MSKRVVPVVVGPTGVGKTAVAVALAADWPITVISADSRQVYRGLDIGTAKPDRATRDRVPHLGLDLVEPGERYSAGRYAREATEWLVNLDPGRQPAIVGGTGLYVRALVDGLFREPSMDPARRETLRAWIDRHPRPAGWAVRLDPGFRGGGRQRAARAVEVALLSGRPLSWWQEHARIEGVLTPWYVRLTAPRAVLHERIAARTRAMLAAGWVDEVRRVLSSGTAPDAPGLDAVGYRDIVRYLQGSLAEQKLTETIDAATRRYARRQETWFRHQLAAHDVYLLDATEPADVLARRIAERWGRRKD